MQRTLLRRSLEQWFDSESLQPVVVGELANTLLKAFGQAGAGVFPSPSVIGKQICRQYGSREIGRIDAVRERYYAISKTKAKASRCHGNLRSRPAHAISIRRVMGVVRGNGYDDSHSSHAERAIRQLGGHLQVILPELIALPSVDAGKFCPAMRETGTAACSPTRTETYCPKWKENNHLRWSARGGDIKVVGCSLT